MTAPGIFCPLCRWRPEASSRWVCTRKLGGCGTSWNTFETHGVCPKCSWHWEITQCFGCQQFSLHRDWYHDPDFEPAATRETELAET
jgi:hypothetical protein